MGTPKLLFIKQNWFKKSAILFFAIFFLIGGCAFFPAKSDLKGIKMRSESVVKDLAQVNTEEALSLGSVDAEVTATASFHYAPFAGRRISSIKLKVKNQSPKEIPAKSLFTKFTLVLLDGKRLDLDAGPAFFSTHLESIGPGSERAFRLNVGSLNVKREDIELLVVSFDLGKVTVVLLPLT